MRIIVLLFLFILSLSHSAASSHGMELLQTMASRGGDRAGQPPCPPDATAQSRGAEYAIRWKAGDGGPRTAQETLALLRQPQEESRDYEIQYYDFIPPVAMPDSVAAVLRHRQIGKKKCDLTFKYRSSVDGLCTLACPMAHPDEVKDEVDVSVHGVGQSSRAYSLSCTVESKKPIKPPKSLAAQTKACKSKMTRIRAGALKVEEWHLPGEVVMVEVSRKGSDNDADLHVFERDVVEKLLDAGVKPSKESKTELGSSCQ